MPPCEICIGLVTLFFFGKGGGGKIRGTFIGIPIITAIVFGGLHCGPLTLGNDHFSGERSAHERTEVHANQC